MNQEATKELLFKMADDALIVGHRNSEWTGLGPVLEEDIAFSSMAQDKIGHSLALYELLHNIFGEAGPDQLAFLRQEKNFKCCQLVEHPIESYAFSLMRHFLFDHAELLRYEALMQSSFPMLAQLAKKVKGELKYHVLHADSWITQLGNSTEESRFRLQTSLNECLPLALGIFEPSPFESDLISDGTFIGEAALKQQWLESIAAVLQSTQLQLPDLDKIEAVNGGRNGYHSEHLQPLLTEMSEVFRIDTEAEW